MSLPSVKIPETLKVTQQQFEQLAIANPDLRLEFTAKGELSVMPPTGGTTGKYNAKILARFVNWNEKTGLGEVFDSSTAFKLSNDAIRSPDVAWVSLERWNQLTFEEQETFSPLCPDFVLELRSKHDPIKPLRKKMQEYLLNGSRLGWLIDKKNQKVEIYRPSQPVEILIKPPILSGENILLGFILHLEFLWISD